MGPKQERSPPFSTIQEGRKLQEFRACTCQYHLYPTLKRLKKLCYVKSSVKTTELYEKFHLQLVLTVNNSNCILLYTKIEHSFTVMPVMRRYAPKTGSVLREEKLNYILDSPFSCSVVASSAEEATDSENIQVGLHKIRFVRVWRRNRSTELTVNSQSYRKTIIGHCKPGYIFFLSAFAAAR